MIAPNDANTYLSGTIQIPSALTIIAITQAFPMVVTTSVNNVTEANTYIAGQAVRLNIPYPYKMFQADGLTATITVVNGSDITLNLDSTFFDPFVIPLDPKISQPATLSPAGSRNLTFDNTTRQVPFQSLNNIGN